MNHSVVLPLALSCGLIIHHRYDHRDDPRLNDFEKWFQIDDVRNHETWVLFFLGIGLGAYFVS
jgi:hypothetical protein